ncbi:stage III sporulation protein AA [Thermoactinomyces sp. DSM 45891]|uniref:stage III sporulation protein AA n=1 Tax=Thermoactinomyces sp. DSM 45891 TaxID=1761907 RepID=UPI00090F9989|nr:stage III sporulation protein AA [Thermoactinomyces sp. DSM 45891]SFX06347.1 stage III sporulation protein AA [Thermoactinomyces sp. DSM 45891]
MLKPIYQILPLSIREIIQSLPRTILGSLEEIRIRQNRPLEVITSEQSWFVSYNRQLNTTPKDSVLPSREECTKLLNLLSNHSLYAMEEELRRGYITIEGGHRVGLAGKVVMEQGRVKHLRDVTGFNIRIAREVKGVGEELLPILFGANKNLHNVLIVSPPQCGKTTLLRDLARLISLGDEKMYPSKKIGIVDERSEIAGCVGGVPQHDVGPRTDILDGCPKAEGMMMMIRSMSPDVMIVDEVGRLEDLYAMHEAIHAGVKVISTAHGHTWEEVSRRAELGDLLKQGIFDRVILLSRKRGPGTIEAIYNGSGKQINYPSKKNEWASYA